MERKFIFSEGEYYHIYNRGSEKRRIFINDADYKRFIGLLYLGNTKESFSFRDSLGESKQGDSLFCRERGETIVEIGAYCLMPNHFHLVLREKIEGGISRFMLKICTGYSSYFNKKYDHSGTLFQGPFRATYLDDDNYLKYIYSYVHLNPIKLIDPAWRDSKSRDLLRAKDFLNKYKYSSFLDYLEVERPEKVILNKESFPEYFSNKKEFKDFVEEWLEYKDVEAA